MTSLPDTGGLVIKKYLLALQITVLMILIRMGLRWLPLPRLLQYLSTSRRTEPENFPRLQQAASYTDRILRLFPYNEKGNCLPRSLILYVMAARCGYHVKFHCGVRKSDNGLDGHAWLTVNGQPLLESTKQSEGMVETFSHPQRNS